jgi:hypothetical protein
LLDFKIKGSEVLMAVGIKISIFLDTVPCSLHTDLFLGLFFNPEDGGNMVS